MEYKKNLTMMLFRCCPNRKSCDRGFTVTEIMIVLVIMGVLMAIAIPNFSQWVPNYRLKEAARDVYTNFQKARIDAIKSNSNVVVSFDVAGGSYQVFVDDGGTTGTVDDEIQNGDERIIATVSMPTDVSFVSANFSGETTPGFNPSGLPLNGWFGNVQLKNNNGRLYKITMTIAGGLKLE